MHRLLDREYPGEREYPGYPGHAAELEAIERAVRASGDVMVRYLPWDHDCLWDRPWGRGPPSPWDRRGDRDAAESAGGPAKERRKKKKKKERHEKRKHGKAKKGATSSSRDSEVSDTSGSEMQSTRRTHERATTRSASEELWGSLGR